MPNSMLAELAPFVLIGTAGWFIYKRRMEKGAKQPKQKPSDSMYATNLISLGNSAYARDDTPKEARIAELHRSATEYKDAKEWDRAIDCLREAAALVPHVSTLYPVKHYLRLPLYLQQAGRFEEAIQEFKLLLQSQQDRIAKDFAHQPKTTQKILTHGSLSEIYKSMSLACNRQKLPDEAEEYATLSEQHEKEHARLRKLDDARRKREIKAREEKRKQRLENS